MQWYSMQAAIRPVRSMKQNAKIEILSTEEHAFLQGDNDKLASIYANALVELAQAKNALDTVHADVDSLQVRYTHSTSRSG